MEEQKQSQQDEQLDSYISLQLNQVSSKVKDLVLKISKRLTQQKDQKNGNFKQQVFIAFSIPTNLVLQFYSKKVFDDEFSYIVNACYIFKFHVAPINFSQYGVILKLKGYAPRWVFDSLISELLDLMTNKSAGNVKRLLPKLRQHISLFDYIQTLYSQEKNLFFNYANINDVVPEQICSTHTFQLTHDELEKLTSSMRSITQTIVKNMIAYPMQYEQTIIQRILNMDIDQFKTYMKLNTLDSIVTALCQEAYNIALQDIRFTWQDSQQLLQPITRRSLIARFIDDKIKKEVQQLFKDTFQINFVHPHPYVNFLKANLITIPAIDGMLFDPSFLFPLMLCGRWFAKTCMRKSDYITSNNSHLMFYGASGTGKSLLKSVISSNIPSYAYVTTGKFQNPDILSSAIVLIDEFDTSQLVENQYKSLLDIKSSVKIDFKNLHPENATADMPCIISSNDELFQVLYQKIQNKPSLNQYSIDAALRRLYIIPMKHQQYDSLHFNITDENPHFQYLQFFNEIFQQEPNKINRMFNFIIMFALFQTDLQGILIYNQLQPYFQKLVSDFKTTIFGAFYLRYKQKVDQMILELEQLMNKKDINDTEYHIHFQLKTTNLKHLVRKFIVNIDITHQPLIYDDTVSWPLKIYSLKQNFDFMNQMFSQTTAAENQLNFEILKFIQDKDIEPYTVEDYNEYKDIASSEDIEDTVNQDEHQIIPSDQQPSYIYPDQLLGKRKTREENKIEY